LAVHYIDVKRSNGKVIVLVELTYTRKGLSGTFDLSISLFDSDKCVLFGSSAIEIWPKSKINTSTINHLLN
jgi:hypothetical protein